jgi:kynureninase
MAGTPPLLSMAALECSLDLLLEVDLHQLRAKSLALTDLFIALVEARCAAHGLAVASPRDDAQRGSQVCLTHTAVA